MEGIWEFAMEIIARETDNYWLPSVHAANIIESLFNPPDKSKTLTISDNDEYPLGMDRRSFNDTIELLKQKGYIDLEIREEQKIIKLRKDGIEGWQAIKSGTKQLIKDCEEWIKQNIKDFEHIAEEVTNKLVSQSRRNYSVNTKKEKPTETRKQKNFDDEDIDPTKVF